MEVSVHSVGSVSSESLESLSLFDYLLVVNDTHGSCKVLNVRVVDLAQERGFDSPPSE